MAFSNNIAPSEFSSEITIRNDAPENLRSFIGSLVFAFQIPYRQIREVACNATLSAPDPNNWGENDFMKAEIQSIIQDCKWFLVYDFIEDFSAFLRRNRKDVALFEEQVNRFLSLNGIGWKLESDKIIFRGDDGFESLVNDVPCILHKKEQLTSANEIKEALMDLSRRPDADITGAVQHSVAALECLAREVTGEGGKTLGALIKSHKEIVPEPLDVVVDKLYGYASRKGRHLNEGNNPTEDEAILIVHVSAALCRYLASLNFKDVL